MTESVHDAEVRSLRDYLNVLRRRAFVVVLTTVAVVGVVLLVTTRQESVYRATAEVLVQPVQRNPFSQQPVVDPSATQTEILLLASPELREAVTKEIPRAPAIAAELVEGTNVVRLSVRSNDPQLAARTANQYATTYVDVRRQRDAQQLADVRAGIQAKVDDFDRRIADLDGQIVAVPPEESASVLPGLQGERDSLVEQRGVFRQRLDELDLGAALADDGPEVLQEAAVPTSPVSPDPLRAGLIALAVGLMLGIGLAFLLDYFDDSIKTTDDVERAVPSLPVLAHIPTTDKGISAPMVSHSMPASPAAEAYRSLRTAVQFIGLDQRTGLVQVTSPSAAEGKTTTVANLGIVLARTGLRVFVVDCDLRRPRIHDCFGLPNNRGFTSVLMGRVALNESIQTVADEPGLLVLTSGPVPPNPSELLASGRTGELYNSLLSVADIVVIDTPPVLPVTDASVVAGWVDATIIVAMAGLTTRRRLQRAVERLQPVEDRIAGVVLNRTHHDGDYAGGYRYRYRYHRNGDRPEAEQAEVAAPDG